MIRIVFGILAVPATTWVGANGPNGGCFSWSPASPAVRSVDVSVAMQLKEKVPVKNEHFQAAVMSIGGHAPAGNRRMCWASDVGALQCAVWGALLGCVNAVLY
jgi:hypothetical protein